MSFSKRYQNPIFWFNTAMSIIMPLLAYFKTTPNDLTTWDSVITLIKDALKNPYVLGLMFVSLWNNFTNPFGKPKKDETLIS